MGCLLSSPAIPISVFQLHFRQCHRLTICFLYLIWQSRTIVTRAGLSIELALYTLVEQKLLDDKSSGVNVTNEHDILCLNVITDKTVQRACAMIDLRDEWGECNECAPSINASSCSNFASQWRLVSDRVVGLGRYGKGCPKKITCCIAGLGTSNATSSLNPAVVSSKLKGNQFS